MCGVNLNFNMLNESQKNELHKRIDEVLYYQWDPIGISDEPSARGEYSSYVSLIFNFVMNEDLNGITNTLSYIVTQRMELEDNIENNKIIANRLIEYKKAIKQGFQ